MKTYTFKKISCLTLLAIIVWTTLSPTISLAAVTPGLKPVETITGTVINPDILQPSGTVFVPPTPGGTNISESTPGVGVSTYKEEKSDEVTEIVGGTVVSCVSNFGSKVAIAAIIKALGIKETLTSVPVGQESGNIADAYNTGSKFDEDIKKYCLDPAARALYKKMLLQTEQSIFNWANNGFKGGPLDGNTFVNDVGSYLGSVKLSAVETWISDFDKTNPFYDEIISAVYKQARSTDNGYTPDMAESILNAECVAYQTRQKLAEKAAVQSSAGGISELINGFRSFIGGNDLPTNNPGYQNKILDGQRDILKKSSPSNLIEGNDLIGGSAFNFDLFKVEKALAQASGFTCSVYGSNGDLLGSSQGFNSLDSCGAFALNTLSRFGGTEAGKIVLVDNSTKKEQIKNISGVKVDSVSSDGKNVQVDPLTLRIQATSAVGGENPCNKKLVTAEDKRAVVEAYNAGQISVTPQSKWALLANSLKCQNRPSCATRVAIDSKTNKALQAINIESTTLSFNEGNTGIRTCVAFLPREKDAASTTDKVCRADGWRTVTPGSLVANQVVSALEVPLENVNKLTGTGTFSDIAQAVLNGLINGLTSQLINSTNGLLSFSSNSGGSATQGEFTRGVTELANTRTSTTDVQTSINRITDYIATLEENSRILNSIVSDTEKAQTLCSQILPLWNQRQIQNGIRSLVETTSTNHRCNIDPLTLNYRDDATAGIKLSQNVIYKEVSLLDGTLGQRDQTALSLQNASATQASLGRVSEKYTASTDPNRENKFASELAALTVSIPQEDSIAITKSQTAGLSDRKNQIAKTVSELEAELAELRQ